MIRAPLYVLSAGAVSSLGFTLETTAAAIRAGVDNFQDTLFFDSMGEPIIGGRIGDGEPNQNRRPLFGGVGQYIKWISWVLEECLFRMAHLPEKPLHLILLTTEPERPGIIDINALGRQLLALPEARFASMYRPFCRGSPGCIQALQSAGRYLHEHPDHYVCLIGVDSWLNVSSIRYGLEHERLLTSEKAEGLIPAEAAAAVVLGPSPPATGAFMELTGLGFGEETITCQADQPCFGAGLAKAIEAALAQANIDAHDIGLRLGDISGEEYFFSEAAYAWGRVLRKPTSADYFDGFPATKVGEIGAGFGPLLLGYGYQLLQNRRHPPGPALIHLSGAGTTRGAMIYRPRFGIQA